MPRVTPSPGEPSSNIGSKIRIPPEICDAIISSIESSEKKTLRNCALVCRDWLPASRHKLFQHMILSPNLKYELLVHRVLRSEKMVPWLASVNAARTWVDEGIEQEGTLLANVFFHTFAGHLPNLRIISLHAVDWSKHPCHPRAFAAFSRFSSVRELELDYVTLPSFHILRRMIGALPALTDLTLNNVKWSCDTETTDARLFSHSRPKLFRLALFVDGCIGSDTFFSWITRTPSIHSIRSMSLWLWNDYQLTRFDPRATLCDFFEKVSTAITFLETFYFDFLPISHFNNLTHLVIYVAKSGWDAIASLLRSVQAPIRSLDLKAVVVYVSRPSDSAFCGATTQGEPVTRSGMELVDASLGGTAFQRLKTVRLSLMEWRSQIELGVLGINYAQPVSQSRSILQLPIQDLGRAAEVLLPKLYARDVKIEVTMDDRLRAILRAPKEYFQAQDDEPDNGRLGMLKRSPNWRRQLYSQLRSPSDTSWPGVRSFPGAYFLP